MTMSRINRAILLALTLLSACAAADPSTGVTTRRAEDHSGGMFGGFLDGQYAMAQADPAEAATWYLRALASDPTSPELLQQAFLACALSGRQESVQLARQLPDNQAAQLLLGDTEARAGNWAAAEQRFRALPRQGLTQLLQPVLVAWAQAGAGHTDAAVATLRPLIDGQRFRGVYALHAAMILDLAGNTAEAGRYYHLAQTEFPGLDLRLAQILASWDARNGREADAMHVLSDVAREAPYLAIALPGLIADSHRRAVTRATDGIAEAYLALAGALRQQDAGDFAMLLLRFALDLRPDFTAARLMTAEILTTEHHPDFALQMLAPVADSDALGAPARLQRALLADQMGHTDDALRELTRLSKDYPESPLPDAQIGDIQRIKQHYPDAIAAYDRAIGRVKTPGHDDWLLYYSRGIAYDRSHQWPKAQADFERALALAPDQPAVLNYLGYSWADADKHLPDAKQMIDKAVQQRPNDGAIVDSLGWVLLREGDTKGAVKTLERAVELEPQDSTINGHLGDAYWASGRKLEATYQWRRALTLNPEPEDAAKLEAKLNGSRQSAVVTGQ
jgi:tetratricopeptide (TPR) repeat protein